MTDANQSVPEAAREWAALGYTLVSWPAFNDREQKYSKAPNAPEWGLRAADVNTIGEHHSIGVNHALSQTCSIDIDDLPRTRTIFESLGVDLDELCSTTMVWRGAPERLKLLFAAPVPALGRKEFKFSGTDKGVFDLRGALAGKQCQDVLPPSIHCDKSGAMTGRYVLLTRKFHRDELPQLPEALLAYWRDPNALQPIFEEILGGKRIPKAPAKQSRGDNNDVVGAFNARYKCGEILERNDYKHFPPNRWLRPGSTTGVPGVCLLPNSDDAIYSHGGDVLQDGHAHDAFDCYRLLEHGGIWTSAVRTAATDLGMRRESPTPRLGVAMHGASQRHASAEATSDADGLSIRFPKDIRPTLNVSTLVADLLLPGTLVGIIGAANSGKTAWTLDLCAAIATGRSFRNLRCRQSGILYIAAEGGHGIQNRIEALKQTHRLPDDAPFGLVTESINLCTTDADTDRIIEACSEFQRVSGHSVGAVVIDTLFRALAGGDENSGADMGSLITRADRIKDRTGAAVVSVHHLGKDSAKGARGHSSLRAALDTEILVEGATNPRTVTVSKQRDLPPLAPLGFALNSWGVGTDAEGKPVTAVIVEHSDDPPPVRFKGLGKHQSAALSALREWARCNDDAIIPSGTLAALLAEQGTKERGRRYDVTNWLVNGGLLTKSLGGYLVERAAL